MVTKMVVNHCIDEGCQRSYDLIMVINENSLLLKIIILNTILIFNSTPT